MLRISTQKLTAFSAAASIVIPCEPDESGWACLRVRYRARAILPQNTVRSDCHTLLSTLDRLRIQPGTKQRWWRSFQKALLEVLQKDEIEKGESKMRRGL